MKTITPNFIHKILILLSLFYFGYSNSQIQKQTNPKSKPNRCSTVAYEKYLQAKNPKRLKEAQFEAWLNPLVAKYKAARANSKTAATIITIPIVVHVIHSGQAIGVAPNITDAQVQSQITVLNQDYRKMTSTPGFNTNLVGADTGIQFVLAKVDPNGNPTDGIDRVNFCQPSWSMEEMESTVKPATIWDPTQYMNMWCIQYSNNTDLGYAQFPDSSGLSGLDLSNGSSSTDGVVSGYNYFGSINANDGSFLLDAPYNQGRTMTHEVGHFLGLKHIWGDSACGNDYCADTPTHHKENYGCPSPTPQSCDTPSVPEMIQNYMDYTDDSCMNVFTTNQAERMATVMANSPRRKTLATSTKGTAISLFAIDAEVKIDAEHCITNVNNVGCTAPTLSNKQVIIYNRGTSTLTAVTLNYSINGGSTQSNIWTGSLATNKSAIITLANTNVYGTLNVNIATANGTTDQRSGNNTASATFTSPATPTNYAFNTLNFTLQQDYFGSETTWNLKDGSGVIKYSGGPYTDTYVDNNTVSVVPALITQNWILANNQCYTFTINDSHGDGICCGSNLGDSGDGYYNLKSSDNATTILSGTTFGFSDSKSFTINKTLANEEFQLLNAIYLYPNPTKNTITIQTPDSFGLPNSYTIYNSLGQIINQKKVLSINDLTINTSFLSNGVYYITIIKEDQQKTLQFIKN